MNRAAYLLSLGLLTPACGLFAPVHTATPVATLAPAEAKPTPVASDSAPADPRKVGDYFVHRFSGSYEKSPLTLTEEVVAQEGGLWVIDYTFEQPSGTTRLRVRLDPKTDSVLRVSKLDGTNELKVPLSTYEKL